MLITNFLFWLSFWSLLHSIHQLSTFSLLSRCNYDLFISVEWNRVGFLYLCEGRISCPFFLCFVTSLVFISWYGSRDSDSCNKPSKLFFSSLACFCLFLYPCTLHIILEIANHPSHSEPVLAARYLGLTATLTGDRELEVCLYYLPNTQIQAADLFIERKLYS
jgi:hypothetical protein